MTGFDEFGTPLQLVENRRPPSGFGEPGHTELSICWKEANINLRTPKSKWEIKKEDES